MAKMVWDQVSEKTYETGVEQCALYPQADDGTYPAGVPWNGLTGITESPEGAEPTALYANNKKYLELMSAENWKGTIEAYTYPDEFNECNGIKEIAPGVRIGQQDRRSFGIAYKTLIGNDVKGDAYGYKLHLVYGLKAKPSEKANKTTGESPEALAMSWEASATPVEVPGFKPTATFEFDSISTDPTKLKALEELLYGTDGAGDGEGTTGKLPSVTELVALMKTTA